MVKNVIIGNLLTYQTRQNIQIIPNMIRIKMGMVHFTYQTQPQMNERPDIKLSIFLNKRIMT